MNTSGEEVSFLVENEEGVKEVATCNWPVNQAKE